jgi:hypothetical protein
VDVIHRFPAGNIIALANKILQLAADPVELNRHQAAQETLVRRRAWRAIAHDFAALVGEGKPRGAPSPNTFHLRTFL